MLPKPTPNFSSDRFVAAAALGRETADNVGVGDVVEDELLFGPRIKNETPKK